MTGKLHGHDAVPLLRDVPNEHTFKLHKTEIEINNLFELADALEIMSDESYNHHVTEDRNDFANWVGDVIKDKELSLTLHETKNRKDALKVVRKRIKEIHHSSGEKACPKEHIGCGIREFAAGFLIGLLVGLIMTVYLFPKMG
ncbi:hypothetical protein A3K72_02825 [Candidatus Woesearchaeota archaeon RBG_13_36_6]|nr:MAG: hypothetical protein A3K72_02825 [Candidatus Woesearchaeota archaeon RBG_13_36_6]